MLPPDQEPAAPRQRFADRVWSLRALIVVALASVVLGGLAGAALANAGDHHDRREGPGHVERGGPMGPPGARQWRWDDGPGRGRGHMVPGGPGAPLRPRSNPSG